MNTTTHCTTYSRGHMPHWIPVLRQRDRSASRYPEFVCATDDSFTIRWTDTGDEETFWMHDGEQIGQAVAMLEQPDAHIEYVSEFDFFTFYGRCDDGLIRGVPVFPLRAKTECDIDAPRDK